MKRILTLMLTGAFILFSPLINLAASLTDSVRGFKEAMSEILNDVPNSFQNIKGSFLTSLQEQTEYESLVEIPGAVESRIFKNQKGEDSVYSFESLVLESDDFEDAKKLYNKLYNELNTASWFSGNKIPFALKGEYDEPEDSKKIISTVFNVQSPMPDVKNLKVDLSLAYELFSWKLYIRVYDKIPDEDMRPTKIMTQ